MNLFSADPIVYVVRLIVIFAVLPIHECAHAYISYKLGDPTARQLGRMTINPLVHIDPIGALCLLVAGFGWAKPVPINARYFKNPKWGMALSALAGPVSNLLMGFVLLLIAKVFMSIFYVGGMVATALSTLYDVFALMAGVSVSLAVFNLLPVPPLDGSRLLLVFLPERLYFRLMQYERYISLALFALLFFGVLDVPLSFLINAVFDFLNQLTNVVYSLFGIM